MKNKKGQAAMEFLMTYGWAILTGLIAIGVLAYFGVFSPIQEEFVIYKTECGYEDIFIRSSERIIFNNSEEIKIEGELIREGDFYIIYYKAKREVCKEKEFDEIKIGKSLQGVYTTKKEDLSIDWLNENSDRLYDYEKDKPLWKIGNYTIKINNEKNSRVGTKK